MIQEIIVSTQNSHGEVHFAPMGVHASGDNWIIQPFRPSLTLNNLLETKTAVFNYCDDVRVFAACLTKRQQLLSANRLATGNWVLDCALTYSEVDMIDFVDDTIRPQIYCRVVNIVALRPFVGFNRAQYAVLEAAILMSRLDMLPISKINDELSYLKIAFDKTAGEREKEAWDWLMELKNYHDKENHYG